VLLARSFFAVPDEDAKLPSRQRSGSNSGLPTHQVRKRSISEAMGLEVSPGLIRAFALLILVRLVLALCCYATL
jgi:hypothetical protein